MLYTYCKYGLEKITRARRKCNFDFKNMDHRLKFFFLFGR